MVRFDRNDPQGIRLVVREGGREGVKGYVRQVATEPQNVCLTVALVGIVVLITALVLLVT